VIILETYSKLTFKADLLTIATKNKSEELRIFTSCGCGVIALAITPPGEFGYLPNCGKDSNRGSRRGC